MDLHLYDRINRLRQLKADFGLSQERIAQHTNPKRSRVTVARVYSATDDRYITESNVDSIEGAINKILDEYRKKLCK